MESFKTILAPTDLSKTSKIAFPAAIELAKALSAELLLTFVTPQPYEKIYSGDLAKEFHPTMEEQVHNYVIRELEQIHASFPDSISVRPVHRVGVPVDELIGVVEEHEVDLIVVASHGFSGSRYNVLGSVTERLVRHAPCSVMTIRDQA